jgi:hypothetical protein
VAPTSSKFRGLSRGAAGHHAASKRVESDVGGSSRRRRLPCLTLEHSLRSGRFYEDVADTATCQVRLE